MLKALVQDMNRYGESLSDALKYLNIRPNGQGYEKFIVKFIVDGKKVEKAQKTWSGSPFSEAIGFFYNEDGDDDASREFDGSQSRIFSGKALAKARPQETCV